MQAELVALRLGKSSAFIEQRIVDKVIAGDIDRKHAIEFGCMFGCVHMPPPEISNPNTRAFGPSRES